MATNYYVDADKADDSGDGLSWANAKKHLYAAVNLITATITVVTTIHLARSQMLDFL
jgi:hypothetical protein